MSFKGLINIDVPTYNIILKLWLHCLQLEHLTAKSIRETHCEETDAHCIWTISDSVSSQQTMATGIFLSLHSIADSSYQSSSLTICDNGLAFFQFSSWSLWDIFWIESQLRPLMFTLGACLFFSRTWIRRSCHLWRWSWAVECLHWHCCCSSLSTCLSGGEKKTL